MALPLLTPPLLMLRGILGVLLCMLGSACAAGPAEPSLFVVSKGDVDGIDQIHDVLLRVVSLEAARPCVDEPEAFMARRASCHVLARTSAEAVVLHHAGPLDDAVAQPGEVSGRGAALLHWAAALTVEELFLLTTGTSLAVLVFAADQDLERVIGLSDEWDEASDPVMARLMTVSRRHDWDQSHSRELDRHGEVRDGDCLPELVLTSALPLARQCHAEGEGIVDCAVSEVVACVTAEGPLLTNVNPESTDPSLTLETLPLVVTVHNARHSTSEVVARVLGEPSQATTLTPGWGHTFPHALEGSFNHGIQISTPTHSVVVSLDWNGAR